MLRAICIILALAFLGLGILGITGIVPILNTDSVFVNIGEIVLGALGLLFGMFTRERRENYHQQIKANDQQRKENYNQQSKVNEQQRKDIDQQRKESYDHQKQNNDQQRKENDQQRNENNQQRRENNRHS